MGERSPRLLPATMDSEQLSRLNAQSTLADLPSYDLALDWSSRGDELGSLFQRHPQLPGVVVADGAAVRGVISRGQYLRLVGRYLGHEVYHPRPIRHMFEAVEKLEEPLILPTETPIQEAVGRALLRPRGMIYEPLIVRAPRRAQRPAAIADAPAGLDELRLIDFPDLLVADSRISALRNQQMRQILATVHEGFLLVGPDLTIAAEHSASAERIFATRGLAGRSLPDLLAQVLDGERAELGRDYLRTLFDANVIERLIVDINPLRRVPATIAGALRHLDFRFARSLVAGQPGLSSGPNQPGLSSGPNQHVARVLVRVDDVSREVEVAQELAASAKKSRDQLDLALALLKVAPQELAELLRGTEALLAALGHAPAGSPALARQAHALKGEAGLLGLGPFQQTLHQLEDAWADAGAVGRDGRLTSALALQGLVAETRQLIDHLGRLGQLGERRRQTAVEQAQPGAAVAPPPRPAWRESLRRMGEELGRKLGKEVRVVCGFGEEEVPERCRPAAREICGQLVRNAVVHGLEPPDARRRLGKPALGTVQLALRRHAERGQLELVVQDDGRGLDLQRLRERAEAIGLAIEPGQRLETLIFAPRLSTAGVLSVDAGRGIGLDLVRARVHELGGRIAVHHQPGAYCAFQILLPATPGEVAP
jgi:two-component system chemotaxis sensor kinase CheA